MVSDANFTAKTLGANHLKTLTQKVSGFVADKDLMSTMGKVSLAGGVFGSVAAAAYQQTLLATLPLSVSLCVNHLNSRRRLAELAQQNQVAMQLVSEVRRNTEANTTALATQRQFVEEGLAQAKKDMLPRGALAALTSKIQRVDNQRIIVEKSWVPQITQCQQTIVELQDQVTALVRQLNKVQSTQKTVVASPATPQPLPKGQRGRVAIFIDGANLYHAMAEKGWGIDYAKLLNVLTNNGSLVAAYFYTGIERNQPNQQRFLSYLRHLGYEIIEKDVIQFSDGSKKANLDVELALDMVRLAESYDTAVLVSGDGDFSCAVKEVKQKHVRVEVISFPSVTSKALIKSSDRYLDLDALKNKICKADG